MGKSIFTLTPRSNVDSKSHIIDIDKIFKVELESHSPNTFFNKTTKEEEQVCPINEQVRKYLI